MVLLAIAVMFGIIVGLDDDAPVAGGIGGLLIGLIFTLMGGWLYTPVMDPVATHDITPIDGYYVHMTDDGQYTFFADQGYTVSDPVLTEGDGEVVIRKQRSEWRPWGYTFSYVTDYELRIPEGSINFNSPERDNR